MQLLARFSYESRSFSRYLQSIAKEKFCDFRYKFIEKQTVKVRNFRKKYYKMYKTLHILRYKCYKSWYFWPVIVQFHANADYGALHAKLHCVVELSLSLDSGAAAELHQLRMYTTVYNVRLWFFSVTAKIIFKWNILHLFLKSQVLSLFLWWEVHNNQPLQYHFGFMELKF